MVNVNHNWNEISGTFQATVLKGWSREILPEDTSFHPDLGHHTILPFLWNVKL